MPLEKGANLKSDMATSSKKPTRERVFQLALMAAACFAIGSIGLFIAVLMQHSAAPAEPQNVAATPTTPGQSKQALVQSMNANAGAAQGNSQVQPTTQGAGQNAQSGSPAASTSQSEASAQASVNTDSGSGAESSAHAAKLKLLQAMNQH